jgi:hypothetical protein
MEGKLVREERLSQAVGVELVGHDSGTMLRLSRKD